MAACAPLSRLHHRRGRRAPLEQEAVRRRKSYPAVRRLVLGVTVVALALTTVAAPSSGAPVHRTPPPVKRATGTGVAPGGVNPLTPARLLDTRSTTAVPARGHVDVQVSGSGGVPDSGAAAATLNLTVTQPGAAGFLTGYPTGATRPGASSLNFTAGQTVANLAVLKLGTSGKVTVYNGSAGTVQLIVDVTGWSSPPSTPPAAGGLTALTPARLLDTRSTNAMGAGSTRNVRVSAMIGLPPAGMAAAVVNLTATQPGAAGFLTAYAGGADRPQLSTLNFRRAQTVANLAVVQIGDGGTLTLYNGSSASVQVIVDVVGYLGLNCLPSYGSFGPGSWPAACWHPYADDSPFNTKIANYQLAPHSAEMVSRILGDIARQPRPANLVAHTHGSSGEPTYYVNSNDPATFTRYQVTCTEFGGSCSVDSPHLPDGVPIPAQAVPEGTSVPASNEPYAGTDKHLTVVDQATGWEYDLWHVSWPPSGRQLTIGNGGRTRIDGDGTSTHEGGDGTAAGFGDLAGRVRVEELAAGHIDHALFVNLDCDNGSFVYPAWKRGGRDCAGAGKTGGNVNAPPLGSRLFLQMTASQIDELHVPAWKKTLLHAMADYGMFFGDTGTSFAFAIETESGNQYTSLGDPDPWQQFAVDNGWPLHAATGGADGYPWETRTGYFGLDADGTVINDNGLTWAGLWQRIGVLNPCSFQPDCFSGAAPPR